MKPQAFVRARSFLDFDPLAKWSSLAASVGTGIIYVALLIVLALFADLMVHRGQVPTYTELSPAEQEDFLSYWQRLKSEERRQRLSDYGVGEKAVESITGTETSQQPLAQQALCWDADIFSFLRDRVGPDAAAAYHEDRSAPSPHTTANLGVLSLVVRTRNYLPNLFVSGLARWNSWMWRPTEGDQPNLRYLTGLLVLAVILALLRSGLMFLSSYMAAQATLEAATRLRRSIYHHTFRLGSLAIKALGPSEAVSMFTRHVESVHDALYTWLTVFIREPVKFGLVLAFALVVNFWLSLAFLLFAVLVWIIGGQVAAYFRREGRDAFRRAADVLALLQESLMMLRLVKCYLMELFNQSRVERQLASYVRSHLRRYLGEAIYQPMLIFLGTLAGLVLLYVAGLIVLQGRLEVANAIVLVAALASLFWPVQNWLENRRLLRRGRESAEILFKFLDRPGEVGQAVGAEFLAPLSQQLEFDNVSLREPGSGRMLLEGISLSIPAGQRVALVGPDDMEKHALVYLIPRFLDPTSGEIRIDQHSLRWVTLDSLRAQCALVLQHNLVFNDTVANNIGCGDASYTLPQIIEAAKVAHAHHFIQKLPKGYDTVIGEMGHSLRTSEQFRIALSRAILRDSALVIIEEPTGALLDKDTKDLLDDTFERFLPGRTTIFLPHRISTLRSCDQLLMLHKGRIEAAGTHREMLAQNELFRHLQYLEFNVFAEEV